jgi:two-component system, response regulator
MLLLVEDNPDDEELTLRVLKKHMRGDEIVVVRDGQEALDFVFCKGQYRGRNFNEKPNLILTDINLPKRSGLDILEQFKRNSDTRAIPGVVITISDDPKDLKRAYDLGVTSYIIKTTDYQQFSEVLYLVGIYWLNLNRPPQGGDEITP